MLKAVTKMLLGTTLIVAIFYGATLLLSALTSSLGEVPYQFRKSGSELSGLSRLRP